VQTDFAVPDPAIGSYRVSLADNSGAFCGASAAPEHCLRILAPIEPVRTATATAIAP
jgi:hypothetical protein